MYKPSKELIEQIVAEQRAMKPRINRSSCNSKELTEAIFERASEISTITSFLEYPTISKALELYEHQPQWQEKPDGTGWYWLKVLSKDKVWSLIENPVGITLENDKVKINTRARDDSTIIANSIDIRFIPIPKPNYLEETDNGNS